MRLRRGRDEAEDEGVRQLVAEAAVDADGSPYTVYASQAGSPESAEIACLARSEAAPSGSWSLTRAR